MRPGSDKLKTDKERIIYRAGLHWGILLGPMVVLFFGSLLLGSKRQEAIVLIAFGVIWGIISYINLRISEIVLKNDRLLINVGFPIRKKLDIQLNDITHFDFYQPSLGAVLNFGKIIFVLKNKKKKAFRFIGSPSELVRQVHIKASAIQNKENKIAGKKNK